jgi:quercetin dioxygenase-like cupin family protein
MTTRTLLGVAGVIGFAGVAAAFAATGDQPLQISRSGSRPAVPAPVAHFTGVVRVQPLFDAIAPARTSAVSVTFEAAARTAWHTHPLGQRLIVTSGVGRIQRSGDRIEEIRPGDVVWIPPGQKHWHGASPTSPMTHIAIVEALGGKVVDWLEQVSDQEYRGETSMKIGITVQGKVMEATLIDSETTRDFVSLLPLTLSMADLHKREKFGHLPRPISEGGTRRKTYEVGDLVYWSPGPDVAIYYRQDGQSIPDPGIIVIGKVGSGVEALNVPGSVKARIELAHQGR